MNALTDWLQSVAAAHTAGKDDHSEHGVTVRRIKGGANNTLVQSSHSLRWREYRDHGLRVAWFHWFDLGVYLAEMTDFLHDYGPWLVTSDPDGSALLDRLTQAVFACARIVVKMDVSLGPDRVPLRLCRVDPNLANAIWCDDGRLRWVDWEYSGWGDPALDLADLRWHAALEGLSDGQHASLRENYHRPDDDPAFDERLRVWDCILAARWPLLMLRLLWSQHNGPDRVRLTQPVADRRDVRAQMNRFIDRAELVLAFGRG